MRKKTGKGKKVEEGKRRDWYRQHLAMLLITVLLVGKMGPLAMAQVMVPSGEDLQSAASASQVLATGSDGAEKEEDKQEEYEDGEGALGNGASDDRNHAAMGPEKVKQDVATPSEPRMVSVRADLQPNTSIDIPLSQVEGFTEGNYFIHIRQAGNRQVLTVEAGGKTGKIICKDTGFGWTQDSETKSPDVMALSSGDILSVKAATAGAYAHVDWIGLERIEGEVIRFQAADLYVMSPDYQEGILQELEFTYGDGEIKFTLPYLEYWDMVVIE